MEWPKSAAGTPRKGEPHVKISHMTIPNAYTSDAFEQVPLSSTSGAM
eukprot:CAMPEP_0202409916 /NCGR_PEP_ID=MMETSP1128-20130828/17985_1 /ASSEMBLY_ACC=CAM_ASM_000463 /TAXON_ID=3047 /ORGANISM="Dunaliella tertiolecta, Strain CCMP1320" /LENGTH=46 /DNA_ID= /DNA_START= /DNA_END= /DNA_ORIENTATION=